MDWLDCGDRHGLKITNAIWDGALSLSESPGELFCGEEMNDKA
jgi:hypothetical protein